MSLRDELQKVYSKRGSLTPKLVVDEARNPEHPLHNRFEWDDAVAGEQWRRQQAQELIRSVRITYAAPNGEKREVREYHSVRQPSGYVYEPTEKIVSDPVLTEIVLRDMQREWNALKARYEQFAEFVEIIRRDIGDAA